MLKNLAIRSDSHPHIRVFVICCLLSSACAPDPSVASNSVTLFSYYYPETKLEHSSWRYIRVDLPPWFSSLTLLLQSNVAIDADKIAKIPKKAIPVICIRDGGPPLPDLSILYYENSLSHFLFNGSFQGQKRHSNLEQCSIMQKNITWKWTNEQISWGVWYFGIFNGIGPSRTQHKMIDRGSSISFIANITSEGCTISAMQGRYCDQLVEFLSCVYVNKNFTKLIPNTLYYNLSSVSILSCGNNFLSSCHGENQVKIYSLDLAALVEELIIMVTNITINGTFRSEATDIRETTLTYFIRHGAIPRASSHDYSGNLKGSPLVIKSPRIGRWFFAILPSNLSANGGVINNHVKVCYSLEVDVLQCSEGKAGLNCTSNVYTLQAFFRNDLSIPYESYYLPVGGRASHDSTSFFLEPLLSNSLDLRNPDDVWIYFTVNVPYGAAGGNLHFCLKSNLAPKNEIYVRHGGFPSLDGWDYRYPNQPGSNSSMSYKLYNSGEGIVDFYIFYASEGTWVFGLRHQNSSKYQESQMTISISHERCPKRCFSHGTCRSALDGSGLTLYNYCLCDGDHGGFDCSVEIVSHQGHLWQSLFLIASNGAAVFPAFWSFRQKTFAECLLYTSSGIASGLYHACDVGAFCILNFHTLQFMDFWLSFMAVVSTFVYMAAISEASRRTIHMGVSIFTAAMAASDATRPANIIIVVVLGALGLLVGWIIEFRAARQSLSLIPRIDFRWERIRQWVANGLKSLMRSFRFPFLLAGFTAIAMAATCWIMETSENYWVWHSLWHVSIFTSSFFFLCSKSNASSSESGFAERRIYELTRQGSPL